MFRQPKNVIARYVEAINRQDLDAIGQLLDADACIVDTRGAVLAGRDNICQLFTRLFDLDLDFGMELLSLSLSADAVLVRFRLSSTDPHLAGIGLAAFKVDDGRITEVSVTRDDRNSPVLPTLVPDLLIKPSVRSRA